MRRSNNIRGPTSALTEFLRESGITPTTIARRVRQAEQQPQAGPSNANAVQSANENGGERVSPQRRRQSEAAADYNSDNLDDDDEGVHKSPAKKRKLSKKEEEKLKAREKSKGKGKGKKGKKKGDENDDYEDSSEDDEYTALSRAMERNRTRASAPKAPIGSFENCAKCEKQFTVTKYTMEANPGPGWLCHVCAKASGADPFKKPAVPRKRKGPDEKRKVISFEDKEFPSLASMCIQIISEHIDDVEALGDLGALSKYEIGRVIAKNRSLTPENAPLLYDIRNTELTFHDATKLGPNAFCSLASLNPGLESLRLEFCGRINDISVKHWAEHLPNLNRVDLLGPFLVKPEAWQEFFKGHPDLTGFLITQSPRFDVDCISSLAQHCSDLTELRLSEIGKMSDEFLGYIKGFERLTSLDLSKPSTSLSTEAVIDLLKVVGPRLIHLNLSNNELLTDEVITEGLTPNTEALTSVSLIELPEITDAAMGAFFNDTANPALTSIVLSRNPALSDITLKALLKHSGKELRELDINSWKDVSNEALLTIGELAKDLRKLDLGFCRDVDDFVVKNIIDGCKNIKEVQVYGCNRLTNNCPRKHGVSIRGIETHTF